MDYNKNNELDQANLRVIVASCALVYITVLGFLPGESIASYLPVIYYIISFILLSIGLRQAIAPLAWALPMASGAGHRA